MNFLDKFRSYKFWVALASAVIIFLNTLGKELGFELSQEVLLNIVMAFCSILAILGFVVDDRNPPSTPA